METEIVTILMAALLKTIIRGNKKIKIKRILSIKKVVFFIFTIYFLSL
jgi:hypothetical protein